MSTQTTTAPRSISLAASPVRPTDPATPAARRPRVWLVAGIGTTPDPTDHPVVRDNRMVTWHPDPTGTYHSPDGYHHATWTELHSRFDLVEIPAAA